MVTFKKRLPQRSRVIWFVEIADDGTGNCQSSNLYTPGRSPLDDDNFSLMTAQVVIEISGGVSEALHHCGTRPSGRELWKFAEDRCGVSGDLAKAQAVLDDMRTLTGHAFYPHEFAEGAAAMLLDNWRGVSELAKELVATRYIAGARVLEIIDRSLEFPNMRRTC